MRWLLANEQDTLQLGASVAHGAPVGSGRALTVFLEGELGAGKTTVARGLLQAFGLTGAVRSPTYALLESYALEPWIVLHVDLYRLRSASELESIGLRDELRSGALLVVEWPERAESELPSPDLRISLSLEAGDAGGGRWVQLEAESTLGEAWLATVVLPRNESS